MPLLDQAPRGYRELYPCFIACRLGRLVVIDDHHTPQPMPAAVKACLCFEMTCMLLSDQCHGMVVEDIRLAIIGRQLLKEDMVGIKRTGPRACLEGMDEIWLL